MVYIDSRILISVSDRQWYYYTECSIKGRIIRVQYHVPMLNFVRVHNSCIGTIPQMIITQLLSRRIIRLYEVIWAWVSCILFSNRKCNYLLVTFLKVKSVSGKMNGNTNLMYLLQNNNTIRNKQHVYNYCYYYYYYRRKKHSNTKQKYGLSTIRRCHNFRWKDLGNNNGHCILLNITYIMLYNCTPCHQVIDCVNLVIEICFWKK